VTSKKVNICFLTWQKHRRTRELADAMKIPLIELTTSRKGLRRYLTLGVSTIRKLSKIRPEVLIVQNPSIILSALCVLLRPVFRYKLVIDAHNEAIEPVVHKHPIICGLAKFAIRRSNLVIVTNANLARRAKQIGGKTFVLPDRIPDVDQDAIENQDARGYIAVISTAAPDEPLQIVLDSALVLGDLQFYITGDKDRFSRRYGTRLPNNVRLTGFLPNSEYWRLLKCAAVTIDLTDMPDCLVCGAYESVAIGTPMILTRNRATEEIFKECAVLVENQAEALIRSIHQVVQKQRYWRNQIRNFKKVYREAWQIKLVELLDSMRTLAG